MRITPWILLDVIIMLVLSFGTMVLFNILNIYYLRKTNVNKWILLALSLISIFLSMWFQYKLYHWILILLTMLVAIFFLVWFFDVHKNPKGKKTSKNEKKIVMKPKAKPNRAKKLNNDDKNNNK